jgi:DNA-directed RNA polymerase subunit K/omega
MSDLDSNDDIEMTRDDEEEEETYEEVPEDQASETSTANSDGEQLNLQKIEQVTKTRVIQESHPELQVHFNEDIQKLCELKTDSEDPLHQTNPILTKYERARILGERAKQLADGDEPFVSVDKTIIDPFLIAEMELKAKVLPFIIFRPIGGNGEYWRLRDLEDLCE